MKYKSYFALLALFLLGQNAVTQASEQNNTNKSILAPINTQQNQSRSQTIGRGLYSNRNNQSQGKYGDMTIGFKATTCRSPSLFLNVAILPYQNKYFGTFSGNSNDKNWMPQGTIGVQLPFGPQVTSCVQAMKQQAKQTEITTRMGVLNECIKTLRLTKSIQLKTKYLAHSFPTLHNNCQAVWNQANSVNKDQFKSL